MILKIKNDISKIAFLCESISAYCNKNNYPDTLCHDLLMVIDEMVTNVISYGFPSGGDHEIEITLNNQNNNEILLVIKDDGVEFNPLLTKDPNTELSIQEREIGGLGIFIVKNISKSVDYKRTDNYNILTVCIDILRHINKTE